MRSLAGAFRALMVGRDRVRRRLAMSLCGVGIVSVGVGMLMSARLGMDPFGAFVVGAGLVSGLSYAAAFLLIQLVLAVLAFLLDRHYLHVSTVLSLLLVGPIAQAARGVIDALVPLPGMPARLLLLAAALGIVCLGSSLYMTSDMGVSSYDALPIIIANKTGWPFRLVRVGADSLCTLAGFLYGATVGIGTLLTALALGPVIDWFNRKVSRPLLEGAGKPTRGQRV